MRTPWFFVKCFVVALAPVPASAGSPDTAISGRPPAADILGRMERTINGFQDQSMDVRFTIVDVDGTRKAYDFTIQQKGSEKRMIRFNSGELKGMATLVEDRNRVYVYLPGFKKVRRVAAHNMNQTFAGSDFTTDDMASASWTDLYDAQIQREEPDRWVLLCTPKPDAKAPYGKAIVEVDRHSFQQLRVEYYDEHGTKLKVMESRDSKSYHGVDRSSRVTLTDSRTGHRTELEVMDFRVNLGLPDSLFTERELEWAK